SETENRQAYSTAEQFADDLKIMRDSLYKNKGERLARLLVEPLLRNLDTFGFHFYALDVRQHAPVHEQALAALSTVLMSNAAAARTLLGNLRDIGRLQRTYSAKSMEVYIISGTAAPDDVLSFVWLAKLGDIDLSRMMPVPLFESIESLRNSAQIC